MVKNVLMFILMWLMVSAVYLGLKASDKSLKKQLAAALLFGATSAVVAVAISALIINIF